MEKMHYKRILGLFILLFAFVATSPIDVMAEKTEQQKACEYLDVYSNIPDRYGIDIDLDDNGKVKVSMAKSSDATKSIGEDKIKFKVFRLSTFKEYNEETNEINYQDSKYITNENDIKGKVSSLTLKPGGSITIERTGDLATQNGIEVALKPDGFTDSFLSKKIKTCKPKDNHRYKDGWYAQVFMDVQGSQGGGEYSRDLGGSVDLSSSEFDCTNVDTSKGWSNEESLKYKFCYAKKQAQNNKKDFKFADLKGDYSNAGNLYKDYTKSNKGLDKFYCEKTSILNSSQDYSILNGKVVYSNNYYTEENRDYVYGHADITKSVGEYVYNYEKYRYEEGTAYKEAATCKLECEEAVIVEYGPPVASEAGLCFGYKVKLTSIVSCKQIEEVKKPKEKANWCTPYPICVHKGGKTYNQGGPNDSFDSCIKSCDKGKYTDKCVTKCYNKVYGKGSLKGVNSLDLSYSESDFDKEGILKDPKYIYTKSGISWVTGTGTTRSCNTGNHNSSNWYTCSSDSIWHQNNSWGCAGGYTNYSANGIPKRFSCTDSCSWKGCTDKYTYLNQKQAERDVDKNLEKYEELKKECTAAASCTTTTAEFTISVTTDGKSIDDKTAKKFKFPYSTSRDKDKLQAQGASEGAVNNDNKQDSSSTIIKYDGCYSKWDQKRWYQTEWTFPGTWISNKTKKISYTPVNKKGYRFYDGLYCLPRNAADVNEEWWYYYYSNKIDMLTPQYSVEDKEYKQNCSTDNKSVSTCDYSKYNWTKEQAKKKKATWNIGAESERFGYFGWDISIRCFYAATSKTCPNESTTKTTTTKTCSSDPNAGYRIRTVDLENLFPDDEGNKLSTADSTGRSPGFNWSKYATQTTKDTVYTSNPVAYTKWVQKEGNKIYSDSNIDYRIELTKDMINNLKNEVKNKDFNYTSINNAAEVSVDSVTHYQSSYIRKHATIYPDLNTLKCNNISTTKARGAGYSDSCQVFK